MAEPAPRAAARDNVERALGELSAEVRGLGQRIDELRDDFRLRGADADELERRLRAIEVRAATEDAARASADRAHARWRTVITIVLGGASGVFGAFADRWLGGQHP